MDDKYKLGKFEFDTQEEYEKAVEELKLIDNIVRKFDMDSAETAKKLLELVHLKELAFETVIGDSFIKVLKKTIEASGLEKGDSQRGKETGGQGSRSEGSRKEGKGKPSRALRGVFLSILLVVYILVIKSGGPVTMEGDKGGGTEVPANCYDMANEGFLVMASAFIDSEVSTEGVTEWLKESCVDLYYDEPSGFYRMGFHVTFNGIPGIMYYEYNDKGQAAFEWVSGTTESIDFDTLYRSFCTKNYLYVLDDEGNWNRDEENYYYVWMDRIMVEIDNVNIPNSVYFVPYQETPIPPAHQAKTVKK